MDQNKLGAVDNHLNQAGIGEHIYCVLCGRMTPDQKQIVRKRAIVDTQLFIDILKWSVKESGHPGYQDTVIPEKCPQTLFVEDKETQNNTDESVNVNMETNIESGAYYFSSAQEPSDNTSVYGSSDKFALAMFQRLTPTLLAYVGTYANTKELNIENILPFAFPFGISGPKMKRKVKVSHELCIQHYMRLSLLQFMEGPTILVMNHILNRQMSYKTGVMLCRSTVDGTPLGEKLSTVSMSELKKINDDKTDHLNANTKSLIKAISTSCRAMGHTEEAAKYARRCCFAMMDHYGLNSLFLSTTPDDECSLELDSTLNPKIGQVY